MKLASLAVALLAAAPRGQDVLPEDQRASLAFLERNLPDSDRGTLTPEFLRQQVALAHHAKDTVPWGKTLDTALFHGFVLPYAQANERREDWRTGFVERFLPLVARCPDPGAAARKLNETIFATLKVHYSTQRKAADQCPSESIAQGKATCTGLAILLADACRACCVPARLVSVRWPHKAGNHTWVEVWDGAAWRFVGADEPDPAGLDRGWFTGDAAHSAAADAAHRIYAVSFAPTGTRFRAGWNPGVELHGIDVSARYAQGPATQSRPSSADDALRTLFARFFAASPAERAAFEFDRNLDAELATSAGDARLRALAFTAWRAAPHVELRADFAANRVRAGGKESPFVWKQVGTRPKNGFALVIAMHGGGGVAKAVNDQQWRHMQIYYKDHPEAGGYLYCALRAPTDEWNGFYTEYAYPLIEQLVREFVVCGDVDPDKVFAIGYSHGGYGAFAIGPKLADRFAAVHASAAAPTPGETVATGLHNLPFSFMVGEFDTAYGRRERCEAFDRAIQELRTACPGEYPVTFLFAKGHQHTGLPDRDRLAEILPLVRTPTPKVLHWEPSDGVVRGHYWLHVATPARGQRIDAELVGQELRVRSTGTKDAAAWLDAQLLDPTKPLTLVEGEHRREVKLAPSLRTLCATLDERGDPMLAATCLVPLDAGR